MTSFRVAPSDYTEPYQCEPLLPQKRLEELRARSRVVVEQSYRPAGSAHPSTIASLRELVRAMNSYYSNRIEGQSTHPHNIERAMKRDFSKKPEVARLQRLAVAHIEAERELEARVAQGMHPLSRPFVQAAHAAIYQRLSIEDRTSPDGKLVKPGVLRNGRVIVGRHIAPAPKALPAFLDHLAKTYDRRFPLDDQLYVVGAEHQRMAWTHPFIDGNGRAGRLQTHCALWNMSAGLWSVSRGFARQRDEYYAHLAAADSPRQGDLDGRGNLSESQLRAWCLWFIGICEDQVRFMAAMLDLDGMKKRIQALVAFRAAQDPRLRMEAALPLFHLFLAGPTARGEFQQLTGLGQRTARSLLSRLLETGLVSSDGHTSPVRFAFPLDALQFLLPELYPEASTRVDE